MKKHKEKIGFGIVIGVFSVIIIACLISIFSQLNTENKEKEEFRQLSEIVTEKDIPIIANNVVYENQIAENKTNNSDVPYTSYYEPHSVSELISMNSDCFGWISIAGTNINYPVMHTPNNPQKYLNKNFYGEYSFSGTPFIDARCSSDSTNLIIYGHHMNNGTMFADLCNYTDYSYFAEHPTVVLKTQEGALSYTVFAVMKVKSDDDWYRFTSALTENRYNSMIEYAKSHSLYDTGITPAYGRQILTLSTCYGNSSDGRILVLAVKN